MKLIDALLQKTLRDYGQFHPGARFRAAKILVK
jgi:hypothetical protein